MRSLKFFKYGGYEQLIKVETTLTCTCKWATIHPEAFDKGETLCKHLKQLLKETS